MLPKDNMFNKEQQQAFNAFKNFSANWQDMLYSAFGKNIRAILHHYGIKEEALDEGVHRVINSLRHGNFKGDFSRFLYETTTAVAKDMFAQTPLRKGINTSQVMAGVAAAFLLFFGIGFTILQNQGGYQTYGSGVALNTKRGKVEVLEKGTKVKIKETQRGTEIELKDGSIHIEHTPSTDENIFIQTELCEVYPIGTKFVVSKVPDKVFVQVIEGKVNIVDKKKQTNTVEEGKSVYITKDYDMILNDQMAPSTNSLITDTNAIIRSVEEAKQNTYTQPTYEDYSSYEEPYIEESGDTKPRSQDDPRSITSK